MSITITYHGPYEIPRIVFDRGGYDLRSIRSHMKNLVPDKVASSSGVYILMHRKGRGKTEARYVGVNKKDNLLGEAMGKTDILSNHFLPDHGKPFLLLLVCKRPKGMSDASFEDLLENLEEYLIVDLSLKGHDLFNKQLVPKRPRFDFGLNRKSDAAMAFKKLVRRKGLPHL